MSKTRNQRRLSRWQIVELVLTAVVTMVLIGALVLCGILWSEIEQTTKAAQERYASGPVIYAGSFLPDDYDEGAYRDACWRYAVENDLLAPHFISGGGQ